MALDPNLRRSAVAVDEAIRRASAKLGLGTEGENYRTYIRAAYSWGEPSFHVILVAKAFASGDYYEHYGRVRGALKEELDGRPRLIESISLALFPLGEGPDRADGDPTYVPIQDFIEFGPPASGIMPGSGAYPPGAW